MNVRRMRIARWIPKATGTHSEYVILFAFPLQQWLTRTLLSVTLYVHRLSCLLVFVRSNCVIVQMKSFIVLWYPKPFRRSVFAVSV
jgi:hypothetical protein